MHRPLEDWYASIRKKQVDNNDDGYSIINPFNKKSFLYWMETAYRMIVALSIVENNKNLFNICLYDFQRDPRLYIKGLCDNLKLRDENILHNMTFFGVAFSGHSHNSSLNQGKILPLDNKNNDGMTDFELEIVTMLSKYKINNESDRRSLYSISFIMKILFNSKKIRSNMNNENFLIKDIRSIHSNLFENVYKFITLLSLRYSAISKIVLSRKNKHIKYLSIWS